MERIISEKLGKKGLVGIEIHPDALSRGFHFFVGFKPLEIGCQGVTVIGEEPMSFSKEIVFYISESEFLKEDFEKEMIEKIIKMIE